MSAFNVEQDFIQKYSIMAIVLSTVLDEKQCELT